jgi:CelD/BcsL family acetyltransferase involved in cellulose biosynthesis
MMTTEVIEDLDAADRLAADWDRLAVQCSRPYCAYAWLSSWWRYVAPKDASLRVVVVTEGRAVIGIAPWFLTRELLGVRVLRPLGWLTCPRVEPLAVLGREPEVASAVAAALATAPSSVDVVAFDGVERTSTWPGDLARAWPGGPAAMLTRYEQPTLSVNLSAHASYASWFGAKGRHFRNKLGYQRRRFLGQGGGFRLATEETLERDLRAFGRLHKERWDARGGSAYLNDRVERMVAAAGPALLRSGWLRLWSMELDGEVIASRFALRAGTEYACWLGGFDERYARLSPSMIGFLALVEDAFACGAERIDLGAGSADWKRRFADTEGTLAWRRVVPRGRRHVRARLGLAPGQWRRSLARRVPDELRARVVELEHRILSR